MISIHLCALLFVYPDTDFLQLKEFYGPSNEFIKSLSSCNTPYVNDNENSLNTLLQETKVLASCTYEKDTKWGRQASTVLIIHTNTFMFTNQVSKDFDFL